MTTRVRARFQYRGGSATELPTVSGGSGPRFLRHTGTAALVEPEALADALPERLDASILLVPALFQASAPESTLTRLASLGVRVVLALGFETLLHDRCVGYGILPAVLDEETLAELAERIAAGPSVETTVDLEKQLLERDGMEGVPIGVEPRARNKLLLGLTDQEEAMRYAREGAERRDRDRKRRPWLYGGG